MRAAEQAASHPRRMKSWNFPLERYVDWWIAPAVLAEGGVRLLRARMIAGMALTGIPIPLVLAITDELFTPVDHQLLPPVVGLLVAPVLFLELLVMKIAGRVHTAGSIGMALATAGIAWSIYVSGGFGSPALIWLLLLPVMGVTIGGARSAILWSGIAVAIVGTFYMGIDQVLLLRPPAPSPPHPSTYLVHIIGMVTLQGFLSFVHVLTTERSYDALGKLTDEARTASRAKSEFLANTSHELRTPMTAILGYTEMLLRNEDLAEDPARRADFLQTIQRNGRHLTQVLNDVLDLSRIEANRLELERQPVSPRELVREIESLFALRMQEKGLALRTDVSSAVPDRVHADPMRLRQVLVNLVGNALKFTTAGEIAIRADAECTGDPSRIWFDVCDTGPGIPAERLQAIFEPFTQVDASTTRTHGGSGLGLTISRRLCRLMGGEIEVTSEPGRGSTFRIHLPIERVTTSPAPSRTCANAAPGTPRIRPGTRVLLVEDGPDNQRLIRLILERAGATVVLAENGALAVDAMQGALQAGTPFDVVLMDMQMPVMDGYEATRQIRGMGYTGPILALTAHAMSDDRARSLTAGCDEYLVKPIQRDELICAVARFTAQAKPLSDD